MTECSNKEFQQRLEFYLLDLLSDEETQAFEEHMLTCAHCAREVEQFNVESVALLNSPAIRKLVAREAGGAERSFERESQAQKSRRWESPGVRWVAIAAAAAILIIAALLPWRVQIELGEEARASGTRVAVLPFENLTGDTTVDWQARALTHLLITDLTDSRIVSVIPEATIQAILKYGREDHETERESADAIAVATEARARWSVTGNIIQSRPVLIVVSSIIDTETRDTLATHVLEQRSDQDFFSVVDELRDAIISEAGQSAAAEPSNSRGVSEMTTRSLDAFRNYIAGIDHFYKFQYADARKSFLRALEHDSTMAMAYFYLSQAESGFRLINRAAIADALTHIEHATVRDQFYIRAWGALALEDTTHAITQLQRLTEKYPDESEAFYFLAAIEATRANVAEAIPYAQTAIERNPYNKVAFNLLAYLYQSNGDLDKALEALGQYAALAPNEPNPHDTKGELLAMQGDFDEAIEAFSSALDIDSEFTASRVNKTYLLLLTERYDEARIETEYLLESDVAEARSWGRTLSLATSIRLGHFEQSLLRIPAALAQDADDDQTLGRLMKLFMQAHLLIAVDRPEEAIQALNSLTLLYSRAFPSQQIAPLRFRGYCLAMLGHKAEAEQLAGDLSMEFGSGGEAGRDYILGFVALANSDFDNAAMYFERATPGEPLYLLRYGLARAWIGQGKNKLAIEELESLLNGYEWKRALWGTIDVKLHYYLGIAHEQAREYEAAIEEYKHFLHLWREADVELPEMADARERLVRLQNSP